LKWDGASGLDRRSCAEEFRSLKRIARCLEQSPGQTGGEVHWCQTNGVVRHQFCRIVKPPITESWTVPLWHRSAVFLLALACSLPNGPASVEGAGVKILLLASNLLVLRHVREPLRLPAETNGAATVIVVVGAPGEENSGRILKTWAGLWEKQPVKRREFHFNRFERNQRRV